MSITRIGKHLRIELQSFLRCLIIETPRPRVRYSSIEMIFFGTGAATNFGMGQERHRQTAMLFAFGVEMACTIAIGDLHIMQSGGGSVMG